MHILVYHVQNHLRLGNNRFACPMIPHGCSQRDTPWQEDAPRRQMFELGGEGATIGVLHVLHNPRQGPLLSASRIPSRQTAAHKEQPAARSTLISTSLL